MKPIEYYELICSLDEEKHDYLQGLKNAKDYLINFLNAGIVIESTSMGKTMKALSILLNQEIQEVEIKRTF